MFNIDPKPSSSIFFRFFFSFRLRKYLCSEGSAASNSEEKTFHWVQFRNNIKHQDNKNESLLHKYMDLEVNHNKLKIKIKDVCNYKVHHETRQHQGRQNSFLCSQIG